MNHSDAAAADRLIAIGQFVLNVPRRQHRPRLILPLPLCQSPLDSALASSQLFVCSVIHSKRLSLSELVNNKTDGDGRQKKGVWRYFCEKSPPESNGITLV
jgi:hypothetical protein